MSAPVPREDIELRELAKVKAERDALAARLQAVRALHERLAGAWETDFCRHDNQRWPCTTIRLLDASLGTPGDGLAADLADRRADSEFRQRLTERVAADQHILRRLGTPGDEKPQPREMAQDALDQTLMDLNERGETPVVVGLDRHGQPFLAYGWAPGGDGWAAGFVNDDPHSGEFEYSDGTERCQECGAFDRRGIEKLAYPVRLLSPVESSGSAK